MIKIPPKVWYQGYLDNTCNKIMDYIDKTLEEKDVLIYNVEDKSDVENSNITGIYGELYDEMEDIIKNIVNDFINEAHKDGLIKGLIFEDKEFDLDD